MFSPYHTVWNSIQTFIFQHNLYSDQVSSVQSFSCVRLFATPWTAARQASLTTTNSRSLLKPTSIESVMPSNHLILCHPLSSCLKSFPASGSFKRVSPSHQVAKVMKFQLQHHSFQWIFRTDFLQDRLVGSPCCPRDYQESSLTPQFKSINSSSGTLLNLKAFAQQMKL